MQPAEASTCVRVGACAAAGADARESCGLGVGRTIGRRAAEGQNPEQAEK
ncbi:MAG: hypothetical protein LUO89_05575 [Methanothrix sp.]|nr:hypothetical protein [Methanothrix sp.]